MTAAAPRHFMPSKHSGAAMAWSAFGLPQDRLARMAARRNFVRLKQGFMHAVEQAGEQRGHWLRFQVRQANEPVDLWLLRSAVFQALPAHDPEGQRLRMQLHRLLETVFPDNGDSTFALTL